MLLNEVPIPPKLDKSRILYLAQKRALREEASKPSQGDGATGAESSVRIEAVRADAVATEPGKAVETGTVAGPSAQVKRVKKRVIKQGSGDAKKKQKSDAGTSFIWWMSLLMIVTWKSFLRC